MQHRAYLHRQAAQRRQIETLIHHRSHALLILSLTCVCLQALHDLIQLPFLWHPAHVSIQPAWVVRLVMRHGLSEVKLVQWTQRVYRVITALVLSMKPLVHQLKSQFQIILLRTMYIPVRYI